MIEIQNAGQDIAHTNYWGTEHAGAGLLYLSGNAGAWRLLVPPAAEYMLEEMRTGKTVTIEPSISDPRCWDIVFEDGTESPFAVALDKRQLDRKLEPGSATFAVWRQAGKVLELPCLVRL